MRFGGLFGLGLVIAAGVASASDGPMPPETLSTTPVRGSFAGATQRRLGQHGLIGSLRARVSREGVQHVGFTGFVPDGSDSDVEEHFVVAGVGDGGAGAELTRGCDAPTAAVVGIYGRADKRVRALGFVCAPIGPAGEPVLARKYEAPLVGVGQAGEPFYDLCPSGRWLTGIEAGVVQSAGEAFVSGLKAYCAPLEHSTAW